MNEPKPKMEKRLFDAAESSLVSIRDFVAQWTRENEFPEGVSKKISICVDEVACNIAQYSEASKMEICCEALGDFASVTFSDDGKAFNPLVEVPEPDVSANLENRKIGGLGIFLVKKMAKSVSYESVDEKNVLKIVFAVS